jgi:hypothetical protein
MTTQVERWAIFVRDNPTKWKKIHTKFIDAQFEKQRAFVKRLLKTKDGKEKFFKLYDITNRDGFKELVNSA